MNGLQATTLAIASAIGLLVFGSNSESASTKTPRAIAQSVDVNGQQRTYWLHIPTDLPKDRPASLVIAFHGGGSDGAGMERLTKFTELAEREQFIVAYPSGIGGNWSDGRDAGVSSAHRDNVDDVGFIAAMIDAIAKQQQIDPKRIYATGISNSAIFSHYLASHLAPRIAAIAPVVGGIAEPFHLTFNPGEPVSVLVLQGTADPLTPYDGGDIAGGRRGKIISTAESVKKWTTRNGCANEPRIETLPDTDRRDGCVVQTSTWSRCNAGTELTLYKMEGAGHTWPGGSQYLPRFVIGKVCRDFDATEVIWNFFKNHPKH